MRIKSVFVLLAAFIFILAISCREKAKEAEKSKGELPAAAAQGVKDKAPEAEEEIGEKEETAEGQAPAVDLKILPEAVLAAFKSAYPQAVIKGTSRETEKGVTTYEVESVDGKLNRDLLYTAEGKAVEIEEGIVPAGLPAAVQQTLAKEYPDSKVLKAEKLTKGEVTQFELKILFKDKKVGVTIDPNGKIDEK